MQLTCKTCTECGESAVVEITAQQNHDLQMKRKHIQDIFPDWTPGQRELLITGIHPDCWAKIFNGEEW